MAISSQVGIALMLTLLGSGSTALGGALVIMSAAPDSRRLGLLQAFAAGLMLSLSFFDLLPTAISSIGFLKANIWFFSGVTLFAVVVYFIPEPSLGPTDSPSSIALLAAEAGDSSASIALPSKKKLPMDGSDSALAAGGLSDASPVLSLPASDDKQMGAPESRNRELRRRAMPGVTASASEMTGLLGEGKVAGSWGEGETEVGNGGNTGGESTGGGGRRGGEEGLDRGMEAQAGRGGLLSLGAMDSDGDSVKKSVGPANGGGFGLSGRSRAAVLWSGVVTAVGIAIHNFPEGIAVFLGSMKGLRVGVSLAVAIALHNIPEGLAVALPIYFATRSRWKAFSAAALSGLAEPLGVVVVAIFFPSSINPDIVEGLLAGVGGIMAFLVLHEMIPLSLEYTTKKEAVPAVLVGMAVMSANLYLLSISLPPDVGL